MVRESAAMIVRSYLCIRQKEECCQDRNWAGAKQLCDCYRMVTDVNQKSHYHPNVDREHKLKPCFGICIQSTIEAGLNAKI